MDIFNKIQELSNIADKRKAIKDLSDDDRKAYKRYQINLRQKKFMSDADKRAKAYDKKKEYKHNLKANNPDKVREIVRGYVKRFRERQKQKKEANIIVSDIVNDIIDNTIKISDKKKKALYMREYRANKNLNK